MTKYLLPMIFLGIAGCAGNTKDSDEAISCVGQAWEQMGYDTAVSGKSVRFFDRYKEACGDSLEAKAVSQFVDGYVRGAIEFCTANNGYQYGLNNKSMPDVCPHEVRQNFVKGYKQGELDRALSMKMLQKKSEAYETPRRSQADEAPRPR